MTQYSIDNNLAKIGDTYLLSGMTLRSKDGIEGPCDFIGSDLYIFPGEGPGRLVSIGGEVEVTEEGRRPQLLQDRKDDIYHRQLGWRDQMGEENTRSFDPSHEGW